MGPTPVSVFLRMGHSLGKLKDRYIHVNAEGADQLCGRMVSGLPFADERFSILPPHFDVNVLKRMDANYWMEIVDGYENYPIGVKSVMPYLLSSLICHEEFLRCQLNPNHCIFNAWVF